MPRFRTISAGSIVTRSIVPGSTVSSALADTCVPGSNAVIVVVPAPIVRMRLRWPRVLSATATLGSLEP